MKVPKFVLDLVVIGCDLYVKHKQAIHAASDRAVKEFTSIVHKLRKE